MDAQLPSRIRTRGCWFFTVNLLERRNTLHVHRIDGLRDVMERTHGRHAFVIDAVVVLPDHIHAMDVAAGRR